MPDIPCPHCGQANEPEREVCWACAKFLKPQETKPAEAPAAKFEVPGSSPMPLLLTPESHPSDSANVVWFMGRKIVLVDISLKGAILASFFSMLFVILLGHGWWKKVRLAMDGRVTKGTVQTVSYRRGWVSYVYSVPGDHPGRLRYGRSNDRFDFDLGSLRSGTTIDVIYSASDPKLSAPTQEGWLGFLMSSALCLGAAAFLGKIAAAQWKGLIQNS